MGKRQYLIISGVVFAVVALMHLCRVFTGWPFQLGSWMVPLWVSWIGVVLPGGLSIWAFRLAGKG